MKKTKPWKIIQNIANKTYKLEILQQIKDAELTPVFHPWKLYFALNNAFLDQILKLDLAIFVSIKKSEAHKTWKVLEIVNSC